MRAPRCQTDATRFSVDPVDILFSQLSSKKLFAQALFVSFAQLENSLLLAQNTPNRPRVPIKLINILYAQFVKMKMYIYRGLEKQKAPKGVTRVIVDERINEAVLIQQINDCYMDKHGHTVHNGDVCIVWKLGGMRARSCRIRFLLRVTIGQDQLEGQSEAQIG